MNILKNYIESKKPLTQKDLAKMSGISEAKLSRASNSTRPSLELTVDLALKLGETHLTVSGWEFERYVSFIDWPINNTKPLFKSKKK